ncbi:MAG: hypothetical protein ACLTL2_11545 [Blautia sp.]
MKEKEGAVKSVLIVANLLCLEINAEIVEQSIKRGKRTLDKKQKIKCNSIIHTASIAAAGAASGMAQIPGSDNAILTPIQLTMTISLGKVFDMELSESSAKAAIGSLAAATVGRTISQVLVGWIPAMGNAINATTAAALTESMGWLLVHEFDKERRNGIL